MTIALSYTGADEKHSHYETWLQSADADAATPGPVQTIKLSAEANNLHQLHHCHGLVLSGGLDIHPSLYGGSTHYPQPPAHFDPARDAFETAAFKQAMHLGIPVLGICRGLQLINCILGGSLVQDLGPTGNAVHQFHHYDKAHGVNMEPGSQLAKMVGYSRSVVNSAHHQSIKTLGHNLRSNCHSDDGIIEGIEWQDRSGQPFMMAVQWHPERMHLLHLHNAPLSRGLRNYFVNAIHQSTASYAHH
jgi:putative glutamine amidotransferase